MMLLAAKKRNPGLLSTSEVSQNTQDNPIQFTQSIQPQMLLGQGLKTLQDVEMTAQGLPCSSLINTIQLLTSPQSIQIIAECICIYFCWLQVHPSCLSNLSI